MILKALTFDIIGSVFDAYDGLAQGVGPLNAKYGLNVQGSSFASGSLAGYVAGVAVLVGPRLDAAGHHPAGRHGWVAADPAARPQRTPRDPGFLRSLARAASLAGCRGRDAGAA